MVDILGYSLPGVVASFLFMILGIKQPDNLRVTGPTHPVLARVKEDALLTCQLLPKRPMRYMEVRWYRSEPGTPVFMYQDGAEVTEMQMEEYGGRVEWIEDGAAEGSVALRIHDIRPSDNGQYWCRFQEGNYCGEASLLLKVGGVGSAPDIHVEGSVENGVQLVCTATGWFPEPQVHWEDNQGKKLLTASEHHFQDEDGLYYVETTLVLRNVSAETVSCVIHNPVLNEEKRSVISLPEKLQSELASLKVIGSSHPILVKVGEDTQLTCSLSPKAKARGMKVRGVRSHRCPAVHVDVDGEPVAGEQMAEYRGRTTLVSDAIDEGRLTLQIHNATTSDAGQYQCLFEKDDVVQEASLVLMVAESRMPFLMLILCILGPLLVLSLIWMKRHIKVNAKLDSSTASTKLIPSKGDKGVTHGHFHNQTSHRDLTTISPSWPTRVHTREVIPKGRCLGQKEMDHKFCQGQYHKPTISDETPHRDWIIRPQSWLMRIHTREVILTDKCLGQKGIDHEFCQERLKATTSLLSENEL